MGNVTFQALIRKSQVMQDELNGTAARKRLESIGKKATKIADSAVPADIGDQSLSNWWRAGKFEGPIGIVTESKMIGDTEVEVAPKRKTRGPWRLLEEGRQATRTDDKGRMFRIAGKRVVKKTGERVDKKRKVNRRSGASRGWGTWTDATVMVADEVPQLVAEETRKAFRKAFR